MIRYTLHRQIDRQNRRTDGQKDDL